jgi:hypothetical protein
VNDGGLLASDVSGMHRCRYVFSFSTPSVVKFIVKMNEQERSFDS